MKTSTKILFVYGSVLVGLQLVFLVNSLVQYPHLNRLATHMCAQLERTPIHHIEIDLSNARYEPDKRRWEGRDIGPWIEKSKGYRGFHFGSNIATSRIEGDTLYIKAVNDDLSWRSTQIPELRTSVIITGEGVVEKSY